MPGHDNNDQTLGQVSCEQEQDSWKEPGGTGQGRQDRQDRTDSTGQIGQGNRDGKTMAGQSWYGSWGCLDVTSKFTTSTVTF